MRRRSQGVFYTEVLVAVAIVAIAMLPAANAIYAGLRASESFSTTTAQHFAVTGRMEEVLAEPFSALSAAAAAAGSPATPTSYSDPLGPERRLVYLATFDVDNADADNDPFTGTEADVIWVRVEAEGAPGGLETLVAQ